MANAAYFAEFMIVMTILFLLFVCGGLGAVTALNIKEYGYEDDPDLKYIHALVAGMASIALIVGIGVIIWFALAIFLKDKIKFGNSIAGVLLCGALFASGVMSAMAAKLIGDWYTCETCGTNSEDPCPESCSETDPGDGEDSLNCEEGEEGCNKGEIILITDAKSRLVWASTLSFVSLVLIGSLILYAKSAPSMQTEKAKKAQEDAKKAKAEKEKTQKEAEAMKKEAEKQAEAAKKQAEEIEMKEMNTPSSEDVPA